MLALKQKMEETLILILGVCFIVIVLPSFIFMQKGYKLIETKAFSENEARLIQCFRFYSEIQSLPLKEIVFLHELPLWQFTPIAKKYSQCRPEKYYLDVKRRICISKSSDCYYLNASIDMNHKLSEMERVMAAENIDMPMKRYRSMHEFKGYKCLDDCSGHKAGYKWAQDNAIYYETDCPSDRSNSFFEGCLAFVEE